MTLNDYYDATFATVTNVVKGRQKAEEERLRENWEIARWMAAVNLTPHLAKGKNIKPTDLIVFPWEKQSAPAPITQADRQELFAKWDEDMKKQWHGE